MDNYKVYLSGPMTGYPEFNFPAFVKANKIVRLFGWEPVDPAENFDGDTTRHRKEYMRLDFEKVLSSQAVAFLPGWQKSFGARAEAIVAYELELDLYEFDESINFVSYMTRDTLRDILFGSEQAYETVCAKADRLVSNDRGSAYGHPLDDFTRTGIIWGAILGIPAVAPELVGLCMVGVKVSRETNHHKPDLDNLVDISGYSKTIAMVHEERERRDALHNAVS